MSLFPMAPRSASPPPAELGPNITLAQKKRLAVLAKMGLGPIGEPKRDEIWKEQHSMRSPSRSPPPFREQDQRQSHARKARMLEIERIRREQEERELERQEEEMRRSKARGGLKPLGMVMPREETTVPELAESVKPLHELFKRKRSEPLEDSTVSHTAIGADIPSESKDKRHVLLTASASSVVPELQLCSCGQPYAQGAKFCSECGARRPSAEDLVPSMQRKEKERRFQEAQQEERKKKPKKRRRRRRGRDGSEDEEGEPGDDDEDEVNDKEPWQEPNDKEERKGGDYRHFVAESVKGKVSHDNKGFTDADLERRFGFEQSMSSSGHLMSEHEALAMIQAEKSKKGAGSGAKRAQREHAEWVEYKKERMARRSRSREHLVVARK